ncbi:hypothetical protein ACGGAQ_13000 [Micromonospora sp. NPDC047557]|uniref:hypothetical protein n=1 Tax=Micromonospora sp. NPDC047557 TaxID=3364250 RepID=UPI00371D40BE
MYQSGTPLARAMGPAVLTSVVMVWCGTGWLILGLTFLVAGTATTRVVSWAARRRPVPAIYQ